MPEKTTLTDTEREALYAPIGDDQAYPELPDIVADLIDERVASAFDDFAVFIDQGPAVPLSPAVFSALARERAEKIRAAHEATAAPTCQLCRRERTLEDAYDYNPIQVVTGKPLGWYSGDDGELCPGCMTQTMRGGRS